jgi:hypothetical protein
LCLLGIWDGDRRSDVYEVALAQEPLPVAHGDVRVDFPHRRDGKGPLPGLWGRHQISWRRSQVVRQRSAKPSSPVRIRAAPLQVSTRQNAAETVSGPTFPVFTPSSATEQPITLSRQEPTDNAPKRLPTATENAPALLPADPALAAVVDAWPTLPEAVRASILMLVKAASEKGSI